MNSNETRTLWISLGAGLFAALLLYSYSQEKKKEYDGMYGKMVNVVIAKVDIPEMSTLDDTMLEITQRPGDFIEPSAAQDPDVVVGQVAAAPMKKGSASSFSIRWHGCCSGFCWLPCWRFRSAS